MCVDTNLNSEHDDRLKKMTALVHETTHSFKKLYGKQIEKIQIPDGFQPNQVPPYLKLAEILFNDIQKKLVAFCALAGVKPSELIRDVNLRDSNINADSLKLLNMSFPMFIEKIIKKELDSVSEKVDLNASERNLILDYIIYQSDSEKEAYENERDFQREYLPNVGKLTNFDFLIEGYNEIARQSKLLKSEEN